jgi:nitric oxide reductase NorE protein
VSSIAREMTSRLRSEESNRRSEIPGGWEIWFFVLGEMTIFAVSFAVYAYQRGLAPEAFWEGQQHLGRNVGALNTVLLLTSSLFVVIAVQSARAGDRARSANMIVLAAICGLGFALVKAFEWSTEIAAGFTLASSEFSSFYYMLTGIHLGHVLTGLTVLTVLWNHLRRTGEPNFVLVESGAIYWHMVDLLWVILFPLLYLMR